MNRSSSSSTELDVMQRIEDLATLSARLQAPFAVQARVLEEAGLTRDVLERARERWSASVLADPALADRFQRAYTKERDRLAGDRTPAKAAAAPGLTGADASPSLPIGAPPNPAPSVNETVELSRLMPRPALPFQQGTFAPAPSAVEERPEGERFDADATLPISGVSNPNQEPALPFAKLPSQILLSSRRDDPSGSKKRGC